MGASPADPRDEIVASIERLAVPQTCGDGDEAMRNLFSLLLRRPLLSMRPVRDALRGALDRIRAERRPHAAETAGMLAAMDRLCELHDAAIAPLECRRCRTHRATSLVMIRPLAPPEDRVCTPCKDALLGQGWSLLADEPIDNWCYRCQRRSKPVHCVGPTSDPMVLRVCDVCADGLRAAGWRAVTVTTAANW